MIKSGAGRSARTALIVSVVIIASLIAIAIPIRIIARHIDATEAGPRSTIPDKPLSPEWQSTVDALKAFVEAERGLDFKHEFPVVVETPDEFRARLAEEAEMYGEWDPADAYIALKALDLVDRRLNLDTAEDPLLDGFTLGYYDGFSNRLVVQAESPTPYVRSILVHELTHALQDQHFDLDREFDYYDESYVAFQALVEGDATRIEQRYLASLSPEEQAQAEQEQAAGYIEEVPDPSLAVLAMLSSFPYEVGAGFVDDLVAAGGLERLNRAFGTPPTTTEHVLHTDRFLRRERPVEVEPPRAEGEVIEEGVWGEKGLLTMLLQTIPREQAHEAAEGWAGDWFVAWRKGDEYCIRLSVVTDSAADRQQLVEALRDWSATHPTASVRSGDVIAVRACR